MTNEEIVLDRLSRLAVSPLHFDLGTGYYYGDAMITRKGLEHDIENLKSKISIEERVLEILSLYRYPTYEQNKSFQCKSRARRSVQDIWRIYKNYFGDIDIFPIMRALYTLSKGVNKKLNSIHCCTVRKQVFWVHGMENSYYGDDIHTVTDRAKSHLGVPLRQWRNIGLKEGDNEWRA